MLKQDDLASFVEAMIKEVDDHEKRDHWALVDRSDMSPIAKTILSIWSSVNGCQMSSSPNIRHVYVLTAVCNVGV